MMLTGPRRKASDARARAAAPRPLGRGATAVSAALDRMPISVGARGLLGTGAPWFEILLEHPQLTDSFWEPMRCGAALDRISAPTLLVGAWQDIFLEQYRALSARRVPTRLIVGPWTRQDTLFKGGAAVAESLAWLDRYAGTGAGGPDADGHHRDHSVRIWVGGSPQSPRTPRESGTTKNSRIRLQVAGGAHPRFARNPGNGQVDAAPEDLVPTRYAIGLGAAAPSVLRLAAADHATAETAGKAAVHA